MALLEPKEVTVKTQKEGVEKVYFISKFPALAGRKIVTQYPISNMPKVGDYAVSEAVMLELMCYVGVKIEGREEPLQLTTAELYNQHVPDWECGARLEALMMDYNCSFFANGAASSFLKGFAQNATSKIFEILTVLSDQLLQKVKQL